MKAIRSMVLVSSDPKSMESGAQAVFHQLQHEINAFGLQDEISVSMIGDVGRHDVVPLVIVYCLLYTSPSPRDRTRSRMPSSA